MLQTGSAVMAWPAKFRSPSRTAADAGSGTGGELTERRLDSGQSMHGIAEATLGEWRLALLRYVHRMTGSADVAEDIAQEALLRLLRADRASVRAPKAWLFRVATNLVRDQARRAATAERHIPVDVVHEDRPDLDYERLERITRVRAALDRLSPRDREILLMRESGFPYSEIAEVINVRTESVSTLVMRALHRFRQVFEQQEPDDASA
jgi:RNA polymerase sigma-70 factor (ECF subfamily)